MLTGGGHEVDGCVGVQRARHVPAGVADQLLDVSAHLRLVVGDARQTRLDLERRLHRPDAGHHRMLAAVVRPPVDAHAAARAAGVDHDRVLDGGGPRRPRRSRTAAASRRGEVERSTGRRHGQNSRQDAATD